MRDPLNWSIPLFRAFGIQVKLHILYIIITLGMIMRAVTQDRDHWVEFVMIWVVILFGIILLHEFGHCFAARRVDGEAEEILMWPLGGLAFCEVPHHPRAHFITTAGGPFVNVLICTMCAVALAISSYLPPLNPFNTRQLYYPELYNFQTGATEVPQGFDRYFYRKGTTEIIHGAGVRLPDRSIVIIEDGKPILAEEAKLPQYADWVLWVSRIFWVSWMLFLFNLLPAFPMDGGRLLQSVLWSRWDDHRSATVVSCYTGIGIALLFIVLSFWFGDPMQIALAIFIIVSCYRQLIVLEMGAEEAGPFGYDFSKGYTSLDADEPPPAKAKKLGPIQRWRETRRQRKAARLAEIEAADTARLDDLLDKIQRLGKASLTDEERRFMERVSQRYRNRS